MRRPAALPPILSAPEVLPAVLAEGVDPPAVAVPDVDADEEPDEPEFDELVLVCVAFAAAWKALKVLLALALMAKTMPCSQ